ncbi:MAG: MFS transporter [Dehalococcoidia bacterium]
MTDSVTRPKREPTRVSTWRSASTDGGDERLTTRAWALLLVLCGAIFLEGLDVSMMGVALPSIRSDLGMSTSSLQWVVSAYVVGYGGFVLLGGRAADLLGRRRMFLFWLGVFVVFSGLGGLATDGWVLILARFVTGVSAGFLSPAGLSIITTSFAEGPARNRALLVYAGTAAAGFALGVVVGGLLTEINWRWVFFAPVILSFVILLAAIRLVPDSGRPERSSGGFDAAGAASLTGAMLLLVFTVVEAPEVGWGSARTIGSLIATAALLAAFVAIEQRSTTPLVRLGILRSGPLVRANLGAMCLVGAFLGFQFIVTLYMQQLRGWSALETGLALLPCGIDAVLAPTLTPRLVSRFGVTRVIVVGLSLAVVALALFLPIGPDSSYAAAMLPTMILIGIAFALAYGPLTIAATNGIAPEEQGLAGGLVYTSTQFGAALGIALVAAVITANTGPDTSPQALLDGFHAALIVPLVATVIGAVAISLGLLRRAMPDVEAQRDRETA